MNSKKFIAHGLVISLLAVSLAGCLGGGSSTSPNITPTAGFAAVGSATGDPANPTISVNNVTENVSAEETSSGGLKVTVDNDSVTFSGSECGPRSGFTSCVKSSGEETAVYKVYRQNGQEYMALGGWTTDSTVQNNASQTNVVSRHIVIGEKTPQSQIPNTGNPTYRGDATVEVVVKDAQGYVYPSGGIPGTSELTVNLASKTFTGTLDYGQNGQLKIENGTFNNANAGTFKVSGTLQDSGVNFIVDKNSSSGKAAFFGQNARSIGGAFTFKGTAKQGNTTVGQGVGGGAFAAHK